MNHTTYQVALISLLVLGLVVALTFLGQFRPRQWRRLAAWDAAGLVVIIALWYIRGLAVIAIRWPNTVVPGFWDGLISLGLLAVIDGFLILRVINFRTFRAYERERPAAVPDSTTTDPRES